MWLLFRRFLMMSLASWVLGKAARRWPRLEGAQRVFGRRRYR